MSVSVDDGVVRLLSELVAIDSTSSRSNAPVIDVLERRWAAIGLRCVRQTYVDDAGLTKTNLIGTSSSAGPAELVLVGHSDCVPFDAGWKDALTLTERDGRLYGRGACDTKSYLAAATIAAERAIGTTKKPFALLATADEEVGCVGAKNLLDAKALNAKRAIVGEPTSLRPIRANKGYCLAEVEVTGKEGHSAYPDTGASAIFGAARLINRLERYANTTLREVTDTNFSPPFSTLNVGVVSGGKAKNIIPGAAKFTLEWRPLPSTETEGVLREVQAFIAAERAADAKFEATIRPLRMDRGFSTPVDHDLVRFLAKESGKTPDTVAFGTEGPQMAALGAVPVVFGPGDITVAHQTGEWVPTAELMRASEILHAALSHFCGGA